MPAMEYRKRVEDPTSAQNGMHQYHGRGWGGSEQARLHTAVYDLDGARQVSEFEAEAVKFEQKLGAWAFKEGEPLAGAVCEKVLDYVALHYESEQPLMDDLGQRLEQLSALLPALGTTSTRYAGAVGVGPEAIAGVIMQGNTRERMLVVQQFVYGYLNNDIADRDKLAALKEKADTALQIHWEMMEQAAANTRAKPWETGEHNRGQTVVAEGDRFRGKRSQDIQAIDINSVTFEELQRVNGVGPVRAQAIIDFRKAQPGRIRMDDLLTIPGISRATVTSITDYQPQGWGKSSEGPALPETAQRGAGQEIGQFEAAHQEAAGVSPGEAMGWSNPSVDMLMNETHEWVEQQRAIGNPLTGGPSGHTHKFMTVNQLLGLPITPDEMRIVSMGHLMPINCHTAIEVAEAAKPFGATPYAESPTWYRQIAPYKEGLKSAIGANRWPDEVLTEDQRRFAAQQQVPTQDLTLVPQALRDRVEIKSTIPAIDRAPATGASDAAAPSTSQGNGQS